MTQINDNIINKSYSILKPNRHEKKKGAFTDPLKQLSGAGMSAKPGKVKHFSTPRFLFLKLVLL